LTVQTIAGRFSAVTVTLVWQADCCQSGRIDRESNQMVEIIKRCFNRPAHAARLVPGCHAIGFFRGGTCHAPTVMSTLQWSRMMPFNPRPVRSLAVTALLTFAVSVVALAAQEVAPPTDAEAQVSASLADNDVPGLDVGTAVLDRLRVIQEILGSEVPKAAEQELEWLIKRIDALLMRGAVAWPASYQSADDIWVPVKVEPVSIRVDVPEILPRPDREGRRERLEERLVEARRIDWLPLARTRTLLTDALSGVVGEGAVGSEPRERLAAVLAGIRQTTRLKDPVMEAYRAVKNVLAGGEAWQGEGRDDLRQAADGLSAADAADPVARELDALAEAAAPDVGRLAVAAGQLRGRIAASQASSTPGGAAKPLSREVQENHQSHAGSPKPDTAVRDVAQ
jgi:hypothetical protein